MFFWFLFVFLYRGKAVCLGGEAAVDSERGRIKRMVGTTDDAPS
jgi:hypothetical protein